MNISLMKIQK